MDTHVEVKPETLRGLVRAELDELIALRRDLHAHPELSFGEKRTSGVVCTELDRLGIAYKTGYAVGPGRGEGYGVVAHLPATGESTGCVGLRADMDALPISEATGAEYASEIAGVMHACGHDGHTTILLGAARVLSKLPERSRDVTFVFQPAEEDGGGGELMCDAGAIGGDQAGGIGAGVDRIYGLHGWPDLRLGTVATREGPLLASTDDFTLTVRGEGGHAAQPHLARDPILAASAVVQALQRVVSRGVNPLDAAVVTVGEIRGGTANNIIPDTVFMQGTVRALKPEVRERIGAEVQKTIRETCSAFGCEAELEWLPGYPMTINDAAATRRFVSLAQSAIGEDAVDAEANPTLGGEDFSYYGQRVPACFFLLGLLPDGKDKPDAKLHQPGFDFNDDALALGVELMARLGLEG